MENILIHILTNFSTIEMDSTDIVDIMIIKKLKIVIFL
jgi:hypothetical protein